MGLDLNAECPSCGYQFKVKRKPEGMGSTPHTQDPTEREVHLLALLQSWGLGPLTVRDIQAKIFANQSTPISGGYSWNYHLIQATVSTLVGRGLVSMRPRGRAWEYWAPKVVA